MSNKKIQIEHINDELKISGLWAQYWMAMATTGVAKNRTILRGGSDGVPLTDDELIADALNIAKNHIRRMAEFVDKKVGLLKELNHKGGDLGV
jgi:hypothetical protein